MNRSRFIFRWAAPILLAASLVAGLLPAAMPASAAYEPTVPATEIIYIVHPGDTLSSLARRFDTSVEALVAANNLSSTRIYSGQYLVIPDTTGAPQPDSLYQVQRGDTLSSLARRFDTTVQAIMVANGLSSTRIYIGQMLIIPGDVLSDEGSFRIQFAPGTTGTSVRGYLLPGESRQYVLRAMAGQVMRLQPTATTGAVWITVRGADGSVLGSLYSSDTWSRMLPRTQDYFVDVQATGGIAANYSLWVNIESTPTPEPPADRIRIRFAPGATSANLRGTVAGGNVDRYVLRALAGQIMSVNISSPREDVLLTIYGLEDGQPLKRYIDGQSFWSGQLPATQDYAIDAVSVGGTTSYTLEVVVVSSIPENVRRIQFAPGADSATLYGHLATGSTDHFVLRARAGQWMMVDVFSPSGDVFLSISGVSDGQVLKNYVTGPTWSGTLPASQDYRIGVQATGAAGRYSLGVTIR